MVRGLAALLVLVLCVHASTSEEAGRRGGITTHERILRDGYPSEYYDVTTEDGYILQINRIPRGRNDFNNFRGRPVVFLMHGLQGSANSYIGIGPENSIAYVLANVGFDVWIGNARGVEQSRRHVSLDPDGLFSKRSFWDFTFEEIALIDLPTMIDFVLNFTNQQKLHYVGHSQGGTVFLILNSRKPEYNNKFISAHLLAGVGYQNHFPSKILTKAADDVDQIYSLARLVGVVELLGPGKFSFSEDIEEIKEKVQEYQSRGLISLILENLIAAIENALDELSRGKEMVAGAALKQYGHFGQNIRDKRFRSWDYGILENLIRYGRITPPDYNLRNINVDTVMHYTVGDNLLHERDVLAMARHMPNCKVRRVARRSFSHTDFVMSADSRELVTDFIVDDLVRRV
ncbi:unnamed protein product [Colias eurytheme]|nr:unnamed protein product [Colias eurytheme]